MLRLRLAIRTFQSPSFPSRFANRISVRSLCAQSSSNEPPSPEDKEALQVGRSLAKLSAITQGTHDAIAKGAISGRLMPDVQVRLEQDIAEARAIIKGALDRAGNVCSVDEMADRVDRNIVPIPKAALDYKKLLRVEELRDMFEMCMVHLNVMPPRAAWVDGSDKPFSRLDRKKLKEAEALESRGESDGESETRTEGDMSMIEKVSESELLRRKAEMESASKLSSILQGFDTALLEVKRVHKVVKGGTNLRMRAIVVLGDRKGTAGYGEGKSDTVAHAIERACRDAKRNLLRIDMRENRTIHHRVMGKYVKSKVVLWPAPLGTGISACNNFSAVFQLFGIKDVGAKLHGPRCLGNAVKALFNALSRINTRERIEAVRGLKLVNHYEPARISVERRIDRASL